MADRASGYIWGPINAEDLVCVPGSDWVITSGMTGPGAPVGRLYAIDRQDGSCNEIAPYRLTHALDEERFGPIEPLDPLRTEPHGIDVTIRPDGVAELYVVNHGWRESVEVFEILLVEARPTLRWIGAAMMPGTTLGNDVAALGDGGFVVSTTGDIDGKEMDFAAGMAGADTGGVLEWSATGGWKLLPGTMINVANGVAVSPDGEWVYIGGWASCCVKKVRRGPADPETMVVPAPILVDNLTWTSDGALLAAGAYDATAQQFVDSHFSGSPRLELPTKVIRIVPETLAIDVVLDFGPDVFCVGTTGLQVGEEIWVGAARDHGIARFSVG